MTYNMTNITNSQNFLQTVTAVNQITDGFYSVFIICVIFFISFIALKKSDSESAFIVSSFITAIVSILFYFIGFIKLQILMFPLIFLVGALIFTLFRKD